MDPLETFKQAQAVYQKSRQEFNQAKTEWYTSLEKYVQDQEEFVEKQALFLNAVLAQITNRQVEQSEKPKHPDEHQPDNV